MRVPCAARARLEGDVSAGYAGRIARLEQRVDAHLASEVITRSLGGRPRTVAYDLHHSIPCESRKIQFLCAGSSDCSQPTEPTGSGEDMSARYHECLRGYHQMRVIVT